MAPSQCIPQGPGACPSPPPISSSCCPQWTLSGVALPQSAPPCLPTPASLGTCGHPESSAQSACRSCPAQGVALLSPQLSHLGALGLCSPEPLLGVLVSAWWGARVSAPRSQFVFSFPCRMPTPRFLDLISSREAGPRGAPISGLSLAPWGSLLLQARVLGCAACPTAPTPATCFVCLSA